MQLFATPLSHFSRKVRLLLDRYGLEYEFVASGNVVDANPALSQGNPLLKAPVLKEALQVLAAIIALLSVSCAAPVPPGSTSAPVSASPSAGAATSASRSLLLRGAQIIDLDAARPTAPVDVWIENGRITSIHPTSNRLYRGAEVIEARGRFLLPGFIDMHAHLLLHPWLPDGEIARQYDREAVLQLLRLLLAHGITTVRDPGSPTEAALFLREQIRRGVVEGPTLYTAGRILIAQPFPYEPFTQIASSEDIRREIRWQAAAGVDFIKVYASLGPELLQVAIEEAHAQRLPIVGHLGRTSWTRAAELGMDGFEHPADWSAEHLPQDRTPGHRTGLQARIDWLNAVDPAGSEIQRMAQTIARRGAFVDPTLITVHSKFFGNQPLYRDPPERELVPKVMWRGWEKGSFTASWTEEDYAAGQAAYPKLTRLMRTLFDQGVLLVVGTDTPTPWTIPGVSFHQELKLLRQTGVTNADVLRMATINGARALRLEREIGRVALGYQADILLLRGNPLEDLANARLIERVITDGRLVQPSTLIRR